MAGDSHYYTVKIQAGRTRSTRLCTLHRHGSDRGGRALRFLGNLRKNDLGRRRRCCCFGGGGRRIYLCQVQGKPLRILISQRGREEGWAHTLAGRPRCGRVREEPKGRSRSVSQDERTNERTDERNGGGAESVASSRKRGKKEKRAFLQTLNDDTDRPTDR